jgi:hypothetical protein
MDTHGDDREALRQLLAEWASPPAEMIDVIPKGGVELKYLGHAATTRALLECDPRVVVGAYGHRRRRACRASHGRPGAAGWLVDIPARVRCSSPGLRVMPAGQVADAVKELIGDALETRP